MTNIICSETNGISAREIIFGCGMSVCLVSPPQAPPPPPPPHPPSLAATKTYKYVPILKIILEGLYDEESNLNKLRGCPNVMKIIWTNVMEYSKPAFISLHNGKGIT